MFSRWFQKGKKGDKLPQSEQDLSPLTNQNQISAHQQQTAQKLSNPSESNPHITTTHEDSQRVGRIDHKTGSAKNSNTAVSTHHETCTKNTSQPSLSFAPPHATISKEELNAMPEALRNKIAQLSQWHHDISQLQTRLATYSTVLLDLSRAGIDISAAGKTLQENSDLFGSNSNSPQHLQQYQYQYQYQQQQHDNSATLEEIQAFEVFHYSIDLATRQALNPIITASNDQIKHLNTQQLQLQHEANYLKAAQQVTSFHQQFDPNYRHNLDQHNHLQHPQRQSSLPTDRQRNGYLNSNDHHPHLTRGRTHIINNDDNVSVTGLSSSSIAPTRYSVAPTRRTYKESKIRQPVPPSHLSQYRQNFHQGSNQYIAYPGQYPGQNGAPQFAHPHHVQAFDPHSLVIQPPRAQLPTSKDAQRLQHHLEAWKDASNLPSNSTAPHQPQSPSYFATTLQSGYPNQHQFPSNANPHNALSPPSHHHPHSPHLFINTNTDHNDDDDNNTQYSNVIGHHNHNFPTNFTHNRTSLNHLHYNSDYSSPIPIRPPSPLHHDVSFLSPMPNLIIDPPITNHPSSLHQPADFYPTFNNPFPATLNPNNTNLIHIETPPAIIPLSQRFPTTTNAPFSASSMHGPRVMTPADQTASNQLIFRNQPNPHALNHVNHVNHVNHANPFLPQQQTHLNHNSQLNHPQIPHYQYISQQQQQQQQQPSNQQQQPHAHHPYQFTPDHHTETNPTTTNPFLSPPEPRSTPSRHMRQRSLALTTSNWLHNHTTAHPNDNNNNNNNYNHVNASNNHSASIHPSKYPPPRNTPKINTTRYDTPTSHTRHIADHKFAFFNQPIHPDDDHTDTNDSHPDDGHTDTNHTDATEINDIFTFTTTAPHSELPSPTNHPRHITQSLHHMHSNQSHLQKQHGKSSHNPSQMLRTTQPHPTPTLIPNHHSNLATNPMDAHNHHLNAPPPLPPGLSNALTALQQLQPLPLLEPTSEPGEHLKTIKNVKIAQIRPITPTIQTTNPNSTSLKPLDTNITPHVNNNNTPHNNAVLDYICPMHLRELILVQLKYQKQLWLQQQQQQQQYPQLQLLETDPILFKTPNQSRDQSPMSHLLQNNASRSNNDNSLDSIDTLDLSTNHVNVVDDRNSDQNNNNNDNDRLIDVLSQSISSIHSSHAGDHPYNYQFYNDLDHSNHGDDGTTPNPDGFDNEYSNNSKQSANRSPKRPFSPSFQHETTLFDSSLMNLTNVMNNPFNITIFSSFDDTHDILHKSNSRLRSPSQLNHQHNIDLNNISHSSNITNGNGGGGTNSNHNNEHDVDNQQHNHHPPHPQHVAFNTVDDEYVIIPSLTRSPPQIQQQQFHAHLTDNPTNHSITTTTTATATTTATTNASSGVISSRASRASRHSISASISSSTAMNDHPLDAPHTPLHNHFNHHANHPVPIPDNLSENNLNYHYKQQKLHKLQTLHKNDLFPLKSPPKSSQKRTPNKRNKTDKILPTANECNLANLSQPSDNDDSVNFPQCDRTLNQTVHTLDEIDQPDQHESNSTQFSLSLSHIALPTAHINDTHNGNDDLNDDANADSNQLTNSTNHRVQLPDHQSHLLTNPLKNATSTNLTLFNLLLPYIPFPYPKSLLPSPPSQQLLLHLSDNDHTLHTDHNDNTYHTNHDPNSATSNITPADHSLRRLFPTLYNFTSFLIPLVSTTNTYLSSILVPTPRFSSLTHKTKTHHVNSSSSSNNHRCPKTRNSPFAYPVTHFTLFFTYISSHFPRFLSNHLASPTQFISLFSLITTLTLLALTLVTISTISTTIFASLSSLIALLSTPQSSQYSPLPTLATTLTSVNPSLFDPSSFEFPHHQLTLPHPSFSILSPITLVILLTTIYSLPTFSLWTDIQLCLHLLKQQHEAEQQLIQPMANVNRLLLEKVEYEAHIAERDQADANELSQLNVNTDHNTFPLNTSHASTPTASTTAQPFPSSLQVSSNLTISTASLPQNPSNHAPALTPSHQNTFASRLHSKVLSQTTLSPHTNPDTAQQAQFVEWTVDKELELKQAKSLLTRYAQLLSAAEQRSVTAYNELCNVSHRNSTIFRHFSRSLSNILSYIVLGLNNTVIAPFIRGFSETANTVQHVSGKDAKFGPHTQVEEFDSEFQQYKTIQKAKKFKSAQLLDGIKTVSHFNDSSDDDDDNDGDISDDLLGPRARARARVHMDKNDPESVMNAIVDIREQQYSTLSSPRLKGSKVDKFRTSATTNDATGVKGPNSNLLHIYSIHPGDKQRIVLCSQAEDNFDAIVLPPPVPFVPKEQKKQRQREFTRRQTRGKKISDESDYDNDDDDGYSSDTSRSSFHSRRSRSQSCFRSSESDSESAGSETDAVNDIDIDVNTGAHNRPKKPRKQKQNLQADDPTATTPLDEIELAIRTKSTEISQIQSKMLVIAQEDTHNQLLKQRIKQKYNFELPFEVQVGIKRGHHHHHDYHHYQHQQQQQQTITDNTNQVLDSDGDTSDKTGSYERHNFIDSPTYGTSHYIFTFLASQKYLTEQQNRLQQLDVGLRALYEDLYTENEKKVAEMKSVQEQRAEEAKKLKLAEMPQISSSTIETDNNNDAKGHNELVNAINMTPITVADQQSTGTRFEFIKTLPQLQQDALLYLGITESDLDSDSDQITFDTSKDDEAQTEGDEVAVSKPDVDITSEEMTQILQELELDSDLRRCAEDNESTIIDLAARFADSDVERCTNCDQCKLGDDGRHDEVDILARCIGHEKVHNSEKSQLKLKQHELQQKYQELFDTKRQDAISNLKKVKRAALKEFTHLHRIAHHDQSRNAHNISKCSNAEHTAHCTCALSQISMQDYFTKRFFHSSPLNQGVGGGSGGDEHQHGDATANGADSLNLTDALSPMGGKDAVWGYIDDITSKLYGKSLNTQSLSDVEDRYALFSHENPDDDDDFLSLSTMTNDQADADSDTEGINIKHNKRRQKLYLGQLSKTIESDEAASKVVTESAVPGIPHVRGKHRIGSAQNNVESGDFDLFSQGSQDDDVFIPDTDEVVDFAMFLPPAKPTTSGKSNPNGKDVSNANATNKVINLEKTLKCALSGSLPQSIISILTPYASITNELNKVRNGKSTADGGEKNNLSQNPTNNASTLTSSSKLVLNIPLCQCDECCYSIYNIKSLLQGNAIVQQHIDRANSVGCNINNDADQTALPLALTCEHCTKFCSKDEDVFSSLSKHSTQPSTPSHHSDHSTDRAETELSATADISNANLEDPVGSTRSHQSLKNSSIHSTNSSTLDKHNQIPLNPNDFSWDTDSDSDQNDAAVNSDSNSDLSQSGTANHDDGDQDDSKAIDMNITDNQPTGLTQTSKSHDKQAPALPQSPTNPRTNPSTSVFPLSPPSDLLTVTQKHTCPQQLNLSLPSPITTNHVNFLSLCDPTLHAHLISHIAPSTTTTTTTTTNANANATQHVSSVFITIPLPKNTLLHYYPLKLPKQSQPTSILISNNSADLPADSTVPPDTQQTVDSTKDKSDQQKAQNANIPTAPVLPGFAAPKVKRDSKIPPPPVLPGFTFVEDEEEEFNDGKPKPPVLPGFHRPFSKLTEHGHPVPPVLPGFTPFYALQKAIYGEVDKPGEEKKKDEKMTQKPKTVYDELLLHNPSQYKSIFTTRKLHWVQHDPALIIPLNSLLHNRVENTAEVLQIKQELAQLATAMDAEPSIDAKMAKLHEMEQLQLILQEKEREQTAFRSIATKHGDQMTPIAQIDTIQRLENNKTHSKRSTLSESPLSLEWQGVLSEFGEKAPPNALISQYNTKSCALLHKLHSPAFTHLYDFINFAQFDPAMKEIVQSVPDMQALLQLAVDCVDDEGNIKDSMWYRCSLLEVILHAFYKEHNLDALYTSVLGTDNLGMHRKYPPNAVLGWKQGVITPPVNKPPTAESAEESISTAVGATSAQLNTSNASNTLLGPLPHRLPSIPASSIVLDAYRGEHLIPIREIEHYLYVFYQKSCQILNIEVAEPPPAENVPGDDIDMKEVQSQQESLGNDQDDDDELDNVDENQDYNSNPVSPEASFAVDPENTHSISKSSTKSAKKSKTSTKSTHTPSSSSVSLAIPDECEIKLDASHAQYIVDLYENLEHDMTFVYFNECGPITNFRPPPCIELGGECSLMMHPHDSDVEDDDLYPEHRYSGPTSAPSQNAVDDDNQSKCIASEPTSNTLSLVNNDAIIAAQPQFQTQPQSPLQNALDLLGINFDMTDSVSTSTKNSQLDTIQEDTSDAFSVAPPLTNSTIPASAHNMTNISTTSSSFSTSLSTSTSTSDASNSSSTTSVSSSAAPSWSQSSSLSTTPGSTSNLTNTSNTASASSMLSNSSYSTTSNSSSSHSISTMPSKCSTLDNNSNASPTSKLSSKKDTPKLDTRLLCPCLQHWKQAKQEIAKEIVLRHRFIDLTLLKACRGHILPPFARFQAESLFSTDFHRKAHLPLDDSASGDGSGAKSGKGLKLQSLDETIVLCEQKRNYNISIALRGLKPFTIQGIIDEVMALRTDRLTINALSTLLHLFPEEGEIVLYKQYKGPLSHLSQADQLLYLLSTTRHVLEHIKIISFMLDAREMITGVTKYLTTLQDASCEVITSPALQLFIVLLLRYGNFLNATEPPPALTTTSIPGTTAPAQPNAKQQPQQDFSNPVAILQAFKSNKKSETLGFDLELLSKLKLTKSGNNQTNLLESILVYAEKYCPTILQLPNHLKTSHEAAKIDINILRGQITSLELNISIVKQIIMVYSSYLVQMGFEPPSEFLPLEAAPFAVISTASKKDTGTDGSKISSHSGSNKHRKNGDKSGGNRRKKDGKSDGQSKLDQTDDEALVQPDTDAHTDNPRSRRSKHSKKDHKQDSHDSKKARHNRNRSSAVPPGPLPPPPPLPDISIPTAAGSNQTVSSPQQHTSLPPHTSLLSPHALNVPPHLNPDKRPIYEAIIINLRAFLTPCETEVTDICDNYNTTVDILDSTLFFTGQTSCGSDWGAFFAIISNFVKLFVETQKELVDKRDKQARKYKILLQQRENKLKKQQLLLKQQQLAAQKEETRKKQWADRLDLIQSLLSSQDGKDVDELTEEERIRRNIVTSDFALQLIHALLLPIIDQSNPLEVNLVEKIQTHYVQQQLNKNSNDPNANETSSPSSSSATITSLSGQAVHASFNKNAQGVDKKTARLLNQAGQFFIQNDDDIPHFLQLLKKQRQKEGLFHSDDNSAQNNGKDCDQGEHFDEDDIETILANLDIDPSLPDFMREKIIRKKRLELEAARDAKRNGDDGTGDDGNIDQDDDEEPIDTTLPSFMQEKIRKQRQKVKEAKLCGLEQSNNVDNGNDPNDDIDPTLPLFMQEKIRRKKQQGRSGPNTRRHDIIEEDPQTQGDFRSMLKSRSQNGHNRNDQHNAQEQNSRNDPGDFRAMLKSRNTDGQNSTTHYDEESNINNNETGDFRAMLKSRKNVANPPPKGQDGIDIGDVGADDRWGDDDGIDPSLPLFMQEKLRKQKQAHKMSSQHSATSRPTPQLSEHDPTSKGYIDPSLPLFMQEKIRTQRAQSKNIHPLNKVNVQKGVQNARPGSSSSQLKTQTQSPQQLQQYESRGLDDFLNGPDNNTNNDNDAASDSDHDAFHDPDVVDFFESDPTLTDAEKEKMRHFMNMVEQHQEYRKLPYTEQQQIKQQRMTDLLQVTTPPSNATNAAIKTTATAVLKTADSSQKTTTSLPNNNNNNNNNLPPSSTFHTNQPLAVVSSGEDSTSLGSSQFQDALSFSSSLNSINGSHHNSLHNNSVAATAPVLPHHPSRASTGLIANTSSSTVAQNIHSSHNTTTSTIPTLTSHKPAQLQSTQRQQNNMINTNPATTNRKPPRTTNVSQQQQQQQQSNEGIVQTDDDTKSISSQSSTNTFYSFGE